MASLIAPCVKPNRTFGEQPPFRSKFLRKGCRKSSRLVVNAKGITGTGRDVTSYVTSSNGILKSKEADKGVVESSHPEASEVQSTVGNFENDDLNGCQDVHQILEKDFQLNDAQEPDQSELEECLVMPPHPMSGVMVDVSGMPISELVDSDEVYNKQLSWLAFNWRVLAMAMEETTPLFERLKFLAIASNNLDEFFAKRVGGLMRQREAGLKNLKVPLNGHWSPRQQLELISKEVKEMVQYHSNAYMHSVLPALRKKGFRVLQYQELNVEGQIQLDNWFESEIEILLTPIKLDPGHPFPYLPSGSVNLAVLLLDPREEEPRVQCAIVNTPQSLRRWRKIPPEHAPVGDSWVQGYMPVEEVIIYHMNQLFGGMNILGTFPFRVIRNAELERHEEEADDLLDMISDELRERRFAPFVRLEVDAGMPEDLVQLLTFELSLDYRLDVYPVKSLLHRIDLSSLPLTSNGLPSDMTYPSFSPSTHPRLVAPYNHRNLRRRLEWSGSKWKGIRSIFSIIRDGDVLMHHPYHSFSSSTQRFVEEAARDPDVVAIKATLYRTSSDSPVVTALLKARENGKHVAVLVELKARFDEARNVGFAQSLEDVGCNVAYGLVGVKTHAKTTLVVRRERKAPNGLRTYIHIGTGNYNPSTAGVYTDLGLLTCDRSLGADIVDLFKHLTGLHSQQAVGGYRKLVVASEYMKQQFLDLIDQEIENAKQGRKAAICIKVNGIDEQDMVAKLYEASQQGVRVDCLVRGICKLRPGVKNISENMRVVSIIGRFLEHHRILSFYNNGNPLYFIGSADWMARNLQRRVELAAPVEDEKLKVELRRILALCLFDKKNAWELRGDGRYVKPPFRSGEATLACPLLDWEGDEVDRLKEMAETIGSQAAIMKLTREESQAAEITARRW